MQISATIRLVRLELAVRMRRLGWWPWLGLALWSLWSAGQEPRLLRSFGIYLQQQATWSGAAVVLAALVCLGPPLRRSMPVLRHTAYKSLVAVGLAGVVAVVQAWFSWAADLATGAAPPMSAAWASTAGFLLAWTPAAMAGVLALGGASIVALVLVALSVGFSLGASALWFSGPTASASAACGLAALGAGCVGALWPRGEAASAPRRTPR